MGLRLHCISMLKERNFNTCANCPCGSRLHFNVVLSLETSSIVMARNVNVQRLHGCGAVLFQNVGLAGHHADLYDHTFAQS
eukprot:7275150-Pyramimonas_sp.AAC.1